MRPGFQRSFISKLNEIEEGLNFIVPKLWWDNFLTNNQHIKCFRQMRLAESYPLDCLREIGVIDDSLRTYEKMLKYLQKDTEAAFRTVKKQLKKVERQHEENNPAKRCKIPCQWLWQRQQSCDELDPVGVRFSPADCDLLLISPEINAEMAELCEMRSSDWSVVSPQLYRLIWEQEMRDKRQLQQKRIIAIPILMNKDHQLYIDPTIDYHNRKFVQVFIKNCSGLNFCFLGYVDGTVKFKNLVKWLDEGMHKFAPEPHNKFNIEHNNIVFALDKKPPLISYSFYDDQYHDKLTWTPFSFIEDQPISGEELEKIIAFVGSNQDVQNEEDNCEAGEVSGQPCKGRVVSQSRMKAGSRGLLRAGVRIFEQQQAGSFQRQQVQNNIIDVHSSTQEQTPSQLGQRDVVIIQASPDTLKSSRIPFPIWKESLCPEKLNKLAHIRVNCPRIQKADSDEAMIILKDDGKKVILPKQCNPLTLNEDDQLIQKPVLQPILDNQCLGSQAVRKQLEALASEILGLKISEIGSEAEKPEVDLVKDNSQCQDKTCKNDYMDEFDCEESRQF